MQASTYPTLPLDYDPVTGLICAPETGFSGYRWYRGSFHLNALQADTCITADLSGFYTARGNGIDGCVAYADTILHCPPPVVISQIGSTLHATGPYSTYTWILDGDTLDGFTQSSLAISTLGSYVVVANTPYAGCTPTDSIEVDVITNMDPARSATPALRVSPVPNNGRFNVLLTSTHDPGGVLHVLDMTGRVAFAQHFNMPPGTHSIPMATGLGAGSYLVEWSGTIALLVQRIVVE